MGHRGVRGGRRPGRAWATVLVGASAAAEAAVGVEAAAVEAGTAARASGLLASAHLLDHLGHGLAAAGWACAALCLGTGTWQIRRLLARPRLAWRTFRPPRAALAGAAAAAALAWQLSLS